MKTILIIYPHWHPSNLAGVQRPRLIGNYLKNFDWTPRVLTVDENFYEDIADKDFEKIFSPDFIVTRVQAIPINKKQINAVNGLWHKILYNILCVFTINFRFRIFGDIVIRAFLPLLKEAQNIIKNEKIDFVWLPIPNFYNAILGRLLYEKTKVPYGIDYIDPWVRDISNQKNQRAVISQWIARWLEPIAIKKVSVISGVSTPYYAPAIERNFPTIAQQLLNSSHPQINKSTNRKITHIAMPYGFDPNDHKIKLHNLIYPWNTNHIKTSSNTQIQTSKHPKIWLYAGAFLPNSHVLLDALFKSIAELRNEKRWDESIQLWFIGTGSYPAKRIKAYAMDHDIDDIVFENRERYPFLQVLNFLSAADTVMIIGSTEKHYTASKTYQSLLSKRPVFSIFHYESSAVKVMNDCKADQFTVRYKPEMSQEEIVLAFKKTIIRRLNDSIWQPDLSALEQYSARESARKLVEAIECVIRGR